MEPNLTARFFIATAVFLLSQTLFPLNAYADDAIYVTNLIAFKKDAYIRKNIISECSLETKLPGFIKSFGDSGGVNIVLVDKLPLNPTKITLQIEIVDAQGGGGGAWSGAKFVRVEGKLKKGSKTLGSFRGQRTSSGGFMGGFKSTCAILGRCVKALGRDIANWTKTPGKNDRIGE